eukprot:scaffold17633_cov80-Isochrysis_galbana.AAC.2
MPPAGRIVRLRLVRGSLERTPAACLITPANDSLVGNEQPMYWRFINRQSVDAKIRQAAGPELERVCLAIEPLPADEARRVRRDITRWTTGCKAGNSAVVRCPTGGCVTTPVSSHTSPPTPFFIPMCMPPALSMHSVVFCVTTRHHPTPAHPHAQSQCPPLPQPIQMCMPLIPRTNNAAFCPQRHKCFLSFSRGPWLALPIRPPHPALRSSLLTALIKRSRSSPPHRPLGY